MGSTLQEREVIRGKWSNLFPNDLITEQQTFVFCRKLLAVAVSNITYLRALFPEHAYADKSLDGLHLKILKANSTPRVSRLIEWLRGCFEAIEKKYLRQIIVGIYQNDKDPECLIESYNFRFTYKSGVSMTFDKDDSGVSAILNNTKKSTITMLRTILVLTTTLKPLPQDVNMIIKINYYDEVTPASYQPPGFKDCPNERFTYITKPVNVNIGEVETLHNTVELRIKTIERDFSEDDRPIRQIDVPDTDTENVAEEEPQLLNVSVASNREGNGVRCGCKVPDEDGLMMLCNICNYWQHAVCFRVLEADAAPEHHVCHLCIKLRDPTRQPTDSSLLALSSNETREACLWRRTLGLCLVLDRITHDDISKTLEAEKTAIDDFILRLKNEGFIKKKLSRGGYTIDKKRVRNVGIPKYFLLQFDAEEKEKTDYGGDENENKIPSPRDEISQLSAQARALNVRDYYNEQDEAASVNNTSKTGEERHTIVHKRTGDVFYVGSSQDTSYYYEADGAPKKRLKTSRTIGSPLRLD